VAVSIHKIQTITQRIEAEVEEIMTSGGCARFIFIYISTPLSKLWY